MKTRPTLLIVATLLSLQAYAGADKGGNGGDICEDRIKLIRDDIGSWIQKGGSNGLKLPTGVNVSQYDFAMQSQMAHAQISCISDAVYVGDAEKTCKNFVTAEGQAKVVCNSKRFIETSDSDQYVLVHHEYAGLAGLEVNDQDGSHYSISNQISGFLENVVVKKLAVKSAVTTGTRPLASPFQVSCELVGYQTDTDQPVRLPRSYSFLLTIKSHELNTDASSSGYARHYLTDDVKVQNNSSDLQLNEDFFSPQQVTRTLTESDRDVITWTQPSSGFYRKCDYRYCQAKASYHESYRIFLKQDQYRGLLSDMGADISWRYQNEFKPLSNAFNLDFHFEEEEGRGPSEARVKVTPQSMVIKALYRSGTPLFASFSLQMTCTPVAK